MKRQQEKGRAGQPAQELDLGSLPDDVAAVQRPVVESAARMRQARNRLLLDAQALARGRRSPGSWWAAPALRWIAGAAVTGAAVVLALAWSRGERPLAFETGSPDVPAELRAPLRAPAEAPLPLRFSDGSAFTVAPRSQLTVVEVGPDGAGLALGEGSLVAAVVPRPRSRWRVQAGPYTVAVTGTRFSLDWRPRSRSFLLTLHEGAVTLFGPSLGPGGRPVAPNETVRIGPEASPSAEPAAVAVPVPPTSPPIALAPPVLPDPRASAAAANVPASAGRPTWKKLAQAGRYSEALAAAEGDGFAALCRRAPAADLLLLANTARFAQRPQRAEEAFRATRARGGTTHESAVAAFELGRLAHDVRGRYRDSADWFGVYLREEPGGALAHEAAGRRMEALHRAGDLAAANGAAESYLGRYPNGAYQGLARQLLGM